MFNLDNHVDVRNFIPEVKGLLDEITRLKNLERFDEAVEKCKMFSGSHKENSDIKVAIGDLYYEKHVNIYQASYTIDDAITQYQCALELKSNSTKIHYKLAKAFLIRGDLDKAIYHLHMCIKYDNKANKAYYLLGKIETKKDSLSEAINNFKTSIKLNFFDSAKSHLNLYLIYAQDKPKITRTKKVINKILSLKYLIQGLMLIPFDFDLLHEIKKNFCNLYQLFPIVFKGYYLERTSSIKEAIDIYLKGVDIAVGFPSFYISLGDCYRRINKFNDAVNEYKMAIWLNPTNLQAYKKICKTYEDLGDFDNAIKTYKKLISFRPNDAVLYSNMANIFYLKGDISNAISSYQTAIILNPDNTWTSIVAQTLGYVYQEVKSDFNAAISAYQSACLLNPKDIDIYISLGSAFFDKGDFNNALAAYRSALEINPNHAKVHCNMGYLLWGKNHINEAITYYKKAIELDNYYDIAYNNLGVIYLDDLGNLEKAVKLFEKAIEINPNYALAYYNIGRSMTIKGNNIEAARLFQIALDLNEYTNELDTNEIKDRISRLFDSEN